MKFGRNDFQHPFLKLQNEIGKFSKTFQPALSFYDQIANALEPIQQQQLILARAIMATELTSKRLSELAFASQQWKGLIVQATVSDKALDDIKRIHQTWIDAFMPMEEQVSQLQAEIKVSFSNMIDMVNVTQRLIARIDFNVLRSLVGFRDSFVQDIRQTIFRVTDAYKILAESFPTLPEVTYLPRFVLPGAAREVLTTGYALDVLYIREDKEQDEELLEVKVVDDAKQETSGVLALLENIHPGLTRPYIGAHDAFNSSNSDRARHIISSLREIWNHLLRQIAPDELVKNWLVSNDSKLMCKGRPTRRARILYICRYLNHGPLTEFVDKDTQALLKLIDFFNHVHDLELELTEEQLHALLLKTDSWLLYIFNIWEDSK